MWIVATLLASAVVNAVLTLAVWSRRQGITGIALGCVLLADTVWAGFYAAELATTGPTALLMSDLKYLGIGALAVSWLVFMLAWSGRTGWLTPLTIVAISAEPVFATLLVLIPQTRDLIHYPAEPPKAGVPPGDLLAGPLYWPHLIYLYGLFVIATGIFVWSMWRRAERLRWQAVMLTIGVTLPLAASAAYNLELPFFGDQDLAPVAFTISAAVLAWGMLRQHLLRLAPVAHSHVVDEMSDAVLVLDAGDRVAECNRAARELLDWTQRSPREWTGDSLPDWLAEALAEEAEVVRVPADRRDLDVQVTDLLPAQGRAGGRLVVLRDITELRRLATQRARLHAEQAQMTRTLSQSLRPSRLVPAPGMDVGSVYRAAVAPDIGGDFFDVYPASNGSGFAIGDVSGKGAQSASLTAMARYTIRALAHAGVSPGDCLRTLNIQLAEDPQALDSDKYLTVAAGEAAPDGEGGLRVRLALGGHPLPLVMSADGQVRETGQPGTALGLIRDVQITEVVFRLGPGEVLVMFTDGVTEARMGAEFFGDHRLTAALSELAGRAPQGIAEGVERAVTRFTDATVADDLAVLVIGPAPVEAEQEARQG